MPAPSRKTLPPADVARPDVVRLEFADLVEGTTFGPFSYRLTADLCDRLRGPVGDLHPGSKAPPAVLCVLFLQAYADAFGGVLAGTVLVSEGMHCVKSIDSDAEVDVTVTVQELRHGLRKPRAVIGFLILTAKGDVRAVGHMEMSWANTSELAVGEGV